MIKFICLDDKKEEAVACTARVNKVSEDLDFINRIRQRLNEVECVYIIGERISSEYFGNIKKEVENNARANNETE